MRILHIIPTLGGGGAERQMSYLAPELVCMGHDVHVAYSKEGPQKPELPGVVLHQLKSRSNYDPYLLWQLVRIIRRIKPDIIHSWNLQMDILGGLAARSSGVPWILREPNQTPAYLPTWKNRLRVWVSSGASAIVSNSRGGDEYWETQRSNRRRYVIQNGLPVQEIEKIDTILIRELAKSEAPVVLYVGRLLEVQKRPKAFLEALACVKQKQEVSGILCGDGPQRPELELLRNKLGLEEDVYYTGFLPASNVWALMKKASVFVSLSAFEGCPNTVMEAMACGCPLVVSDIPAHREILNESYARFVDPSDIQQIAAAIVQTLCDKDTSKARAFIAKQKSQEWSIAGMARKYERVYQEII